ncbi:MAG: phenylacetate--CoA ligase [Clostridiales bacterium]|jgi:phenylacetate-CoA ligase|nr:phenylacetate--CoA ligase [Clostridiales bacterium]
MDNNFWNPSVERMSRDELHAVQTRRLKETVERVYSNVPYYRDKMQRKGILPGDIKTLEDLESLPFTTKQDLRETYPFDMFAAPMESIIRIHASSGTTGKQTVTGYTRRDIDMWAECMARCLTMAGATRASKIQVGYGYGLFTGGLGAHYGAELIGAAVIPASAGNTMRQITMMKDFGTNFLCCTPSYALYLGEALGEAGFTKDDLQIVGGIFGAEPWSENMRKEIEDILGLRAYDIYGLSEVMGPAVSQECCRQDKLHVWEDFFIPEIIDPVTCEVLPGKTQGELVFTTIYKEGFPLIRYRTRDISSLCYDECGCGRTHARMTKPDGRSDDMLIIRGVNVFPSQVESVLLEEGNVSPHYRIIVDRKNNLDAMTVEIEMSENIFSDHVKGIEATESNIRKKIESVLGISCGVRLVEPKTIARSEGKAKRVIDNRKI